MFFFGLGGVFKTALLEVAVGDADARHQDDEAAADHEGHVGVPAHELHHLHAGELGDERVVGDARIEVAGHHAGGDGSGGHGRTEARANEKRDERRANGGGHAGHRRNGGGDDEAHEDTGRKQEDAELAERLREETDEVTVAARERNDAGKAERRADCDDERAVRHRLIELLEGRHRIHGDEGHHQTGGEKHESRFIALDERIDGGAHDEKRQTDGNVHGIVSCRSMPRGRCAAWLCRMSAVRRGDSGSLLRCRNPLCRTAPRPPVVYRPKILPNCGVKLRSGRRYKPRVFR